MPATFKRIEVEDEGHTAEEIGLYQVTDNCGFSGWRCPTEDAAKELVRILDARLNPFKK